MSWFDTLKFSIDWVNVRVDCSSLSEFLDKLSALGLDYAAWSEIKPLNFYPHTISYSSAGYSSITLSYDLLAGSKDNVPVCYEDSPHYGILVSISGDGCRYLDSLVEGGLRKFLMICADYHYNCTRFDVAMDVFDRHNPIIPLFTEFAKVAYDPNPGHINIKANMRRKEGYVRWMPVYDEDVKDYTSNVYIGDRNSTKGSCCVYNKKVEMRSGRLKALAPDVFQRLGVTDYWYRVEYRAKNAKLCNGSFQVALQGSSLDTFYYLADQMFLFVDQVMDLSNITRCPVVDVWQQFLDWMQSQQNDLLCLVELTSTPYVKASFGRLVSWMRRNAALVYNIQLMQDKFPDFFAGVLDVGLVKRRRSGRYVQFDEEYAAAESALTGVFLCI